MQWHAPRPPAAAAQLLLLLLAPLFSSPVKVSGTAANTILSHLPENSNLKGQRPNYQRGGGYRRAVMGERKG